MAKGLRIDPRFRGPPESGNGGYVAGLLARELGGSDCRVRLRRPPPLGTPLEVTSGGAAFNLMDRAEIVASATRAMVEVGAPSAPPLAEAESASRRFTGFRSHIFPGCFVCGPERGVGDGLRIFPGASGGGMVAAPWKPAADLSDSDGIVRSEFVWAALDCPGYFAVQQLAGPAVLGELAVRMHEPVGGGEPLVVIGWPIESSGRKHRAGTALYAGDRLIAAAEATWVSLRAGPA
jgi:acyl-coenzyme A thioesterase PaaI-like protein